MKIGIVVAGFAASEADWHQPVLQNYVHRLADEHHVRVFTLDYPAQLTPYHWFGCAVLPSGSGNNQRTRWHTTYIQIQQQHQIDPFDILHAFGAGEAGAVTTLAADQLDVPSVVTILDDELVDLPDIGYGLMGQADHRRLVMQSLNKSRALIAPCRYTERHLQNILPVDQHDKIHVVPLGVDTAHFQPPEVTLDYRPRAFVHVGALEPVKDQRTLLHLVSTLPNATMDIVGDGSQREALEAYTQTLGVAHRVVFHGWVPYEKLPAYYQEARFFLMTSLHEAFCVEAVEALACGTGVIGTAVGMLPELGDMAPVGDIKQLQRHIIKRARSNTSSFRFRNRLLAEHEYSIGNMVRLMVEMYERIVEV